MVFVDSIKKGRYIHRSLVKLGIDAVFIDAKWVDDYDELILGTVDNMVKKQRFEQQVVVATSVIDNGVSINDIELRNLVLMADTKEQFIQMLGRKRVDYNRDKKPERINLYILKSDKNTFKRRLSDVENNIECIANYYDKEDDFYKVLKKIQKYPEWGRCFRRICYINKSYPNTRGPIILNKFSYKRYDYLKNNYREIIKQFDAEDEYAFIRQQAGWIGINNIDGIINANRTSLKDKIKNIIDGYTGEKLSVERNIELREKIRSDLRTLLKECKANTPENEDIEKNIEDLGKRSNKNDQHPRKLSDKRFNSIMYILDMEYKMEDSVIKKL